MSTTEARKPANIYDVARLAEVSVPTVSRVLTGSAKVSDDKRARVLRAIRTLNYRPSAAARTLGGLRSRLVAVLAGNTSRYGYAETIRGIEERARAAGYTVAIVIVESAEAEDVARAAELVMNQPIAGVLVLKFDAPGIAALRAMPEDLPLVAISGVREPGLPQAVLAEAAGADELVTRVLALGHRTVHHVRVPPSRREDGRTTGWRRALHRAGAPIPALIDASWQPESGRELGRRIGADQEVTAVFCGNDEIALGFMRGLADIGRRVPDDVSVVGFDDHPLARMWLPGLTTVRQDFADLGSRAWSLLEARMQGDTSPVLSSARLSMQWRESAAAPARH